MDIHVKVELQWEGDKLSGISYRSKHIHDEKINFVNLYILIIWKGECSLFIPRPYST